MSLQWPEIVAVRGSHTQPTEGAGQWVVAQIMRNVSLAANTSLHLKEVFRQLQSCSASW